MALKNDNIVAVLFLNYVFTMSPESPPPSNGPPASASVRAVHHGWTMCLPAML